MRLQKEKIRKIVIFIRGGGIVNPAIFSTDWCLYKVF